MANLLALAIAGALGTLSRYWLSALVQRLIGTAFPWGTFAVNILGSFLFGLLWSLAEERKLLSAEARVIILTGFMGAFTTFSTFAFETAAYLRASQWTLAVANILAQLMVGLLAMFAGMAIARWGT